MRKPCSRTTPRVYIATAQAFDDEMRERIASHQARRNDTWETVDAPLALADALNNAADKPVLVDCLTLWLSNILLAEQDIDAATRALEQALTARPAPTVLVSNEVGMGHRAGHPAGARFPRPSGRAQPAHRRPCGHVIFVAAGLPLTLKDNRPHE
jgi:adenosylcobinamide kinase/adenosylcobinamide-phosphate guanylyltransferase